MIGAMGGEGSELRIESDAIGVSRVGRTVPVVEAAAGMLVVVLVMGARPERWFPLLVLLGLGYHVFRTHAARARSGVVRVAADGNAVAIERARKTITIARPEIENLWHWPERGHVSVMIATRRYLASVRVPDRATASALGRALGIDAAHQLVGTTLTATPVSTKRRFGQFVTRHLPELLVALGISGLFALLTTGGATFAPTLLIVTSIFLLPMVFAVARELMPASVLVGRDGVLLSSFGRREFIGFERIKHVRLAPFAVTLTLTNDEIILLPISPVRGARRAFSANPLGHWTRDPDQVRARRQTLLAQIDAALTRFREAGHATAAVASLLERGPRTIAEWRSALTRTGSGTYREPHLDPDHLADIVENPQSPLEQRLGAALALADVPGDERKLRVRAAVASSANTRVRVALEKAAEGSLDDEAYEAALQAESARRAVT
jgi:hypothetical protein